MARLRPIKRFVLLLDDQPDSVEDGVAVRRDAPGYLDHVVVAVGEREDAGFGPGDRVIVPDPAVGRKVTLDGVAHRLVRVSDVLAVVE